MVLSNGIRQWAGRCLVWLTIVIVFSFVSSAHALNDKGVIVIDRHDFSMRLAKDIYYLEDAENSATLEEIREAAARGAFSRFRDNSLDFGHSTSTYWLKFTVANRLQERLGESPTDRFYLSVRHPLLDDVRFYSVHASPYGNRVNEQRLGDMKSFGERVFRHSDLVFPFALAPGMQAEIYLKVSSEGALSLPIYLEPERAFVGSRLKIDMMEGVYLGGALVLIFYHLFLWIKSRRRIFLIFAVTVMIHVAFFATLSGHTFRLWPDAVVFQQSVVYALNMAASVSLAIFATEFLQTRRLTPRLDIVLKAYALMGGGGMIAAFFLGSHDAATLSTIGVAAGAILLFAVALVRVLQGYRPGLYFLVGQTAVMLVGLFVLFSFVNLLPYHYRIPDAMKWACGFALVLLSMGLACLRGHSAPTSRCANAP